MSDRASETWDPGGRALQRILEEIRDQLTQLTQLTQPNELIRASVDEIAQLRQIATNANDAAAQEAQRADKQAQRADKQAQRAEEQTRRANEQAKLVDQYRQRAEAGEKEKTQALQLAANAEAKLTTAVQNFNREKKQRKRANSETKRQRNRADAAEAQLAPLRPIKLTALNFTIAFEKFSRSTTDAVSTHTKVCGRRRPKKLATLSQLEGAEEDLREKFGSIANEERCVSDSYSHVQHTGDLIQKIQPGNEKADVRFGELAIEVPATSIVNAVLKNDENPVISSTLSKDSKKLAPYPNRKGLIPDGVFKRKGDERCFAVFEYKASHKFTHAEIKEHLANENLFTEAELEEELENKTRAQHVCVGFAKALTQGYAYALNCGVRFGLLFVGDAIVLFRVVLPEDPEVLYCKLVEPPQILPGQPTEELTMDQLYNTPLGQVSSFLLLAEQAKPLSESEFEDVMERTKYNLWPEPRRSRQASAST